MPSRKDATERRYRPDFILRSATGDPVCVGEIKSESSYSREPRTRLLVTGRQVAEQENAPDFLVLTDQQARFWVDIASLSSGGEPTHVAAIADAAGPFLAIASPSPQHSSALELGLLSWFRTLITLGPDPTDYVLAAWVRATGLINHIGSARVEVE